MQTKLDKVGDSAGEPVRIGTGTAALKKAFVDNLYYIQGRFPEVATANDNYQTLAYTIRDRLLHLWMMTFARPFPFSPMALSPSLTPSEGSGSRS